VRRRVLLAVAGVAALLVSIPLALLGRAVVATPAAVARVAPGPPATVHVENRRPSLADRAAWRLVGANRVEPFAEVVTVYRTVAALPALAGQPTCSIRLARLIPRLRSPAERAQAFVMAGTLLAMGAGDGLGVPLDDSTEGARPLLTQALDDFRAAVEGDPANEAAKYDLELLLRQQAESRQRDAAAASRKPTPGSQPARDRRRQPQPEVQSRINDAGVYATGTGY
jgi:hypothetical protein